LTVELPNGVCSGGSVRQRVYDDDVRKMPQDSGSELLPSPGGDEGVLRTEDDFEVLFELTGQISDDVHAEPIRMS
jgi:hypothetical protein